MFHFGSSDICSCSFSCCLLFSFFLWLFIFVLYPFLEGLCTVGFINYLINLISINPHNKNTKQKTDALFFYGLSFFLFSSIVTSYYVYDLCIAAHTLFLPVFIYEPLALKKSFSTVNMTPVTSLKAGCSNEVSSLKEELKALHLLYIKELDPLNIIFRGSRDREANKNKNGVPFLFFCSF